MVKNFQLESKIKQSTVVGDVSTLPPGKMVAIEPTGTVRVLKNPFYIPTAFDRGELFAPEQEEEKKFTSFSLTVVSEKRNKRFFVSLFILLRLSFTGHLSFSSRFYSIYDR